jgi:hypothetical protein
MCNDFDGTRATTTFESILTDDQLLGCERLQMAKENALLSSYWAPTPPSDSLLSNAVIAGGGLESTTTTVINALFSPKYRHIV